VEVGEYYRLAAIEKKHWWYQAVHELVVGQIEALYKGSALFETPTRQSLVKILDAGCGTGGLTKKLEQFGQVTGLDISSLALKLGQSRSLNSIRGTVNSLPFRRAKFDLITSISVLYHQQVDDRLSLGELLRVLKPKGNIILVLPAFSWLGGAHDLAVATKKRYSLGKASDLLNDAGFELIEARYLFSFLFPIFILKRVLEKFMPSAGRVSDLSAPPGLVNDLLFGICRVEWKLNKFIKLPFGSSLLVVGEKK